MEPYLYAMRQRIGENESAEKAVTVAQATVSAPSADSHVLSPNDPSGSSEPTPAQTFAGSSPAVDPTDRQHGGDGPVWGAPPIPGRASNGVWLKRLAPLVLRPGEWARVHVSSHINAWNQVRALQDRKPGIKIRVPPGRWEFRAAWVDDAKRNSGVWARYLGPDNGKAK